MRIYWVPWYSGEESLAKRGTALDVTVAERILEPLYSILFKKKKELNAKGSLKDSNKVAPAGSVK